MPDGEILLRSPTQMTGYYGLDESPIDREGWLHTGDLGRVDDDGHLWITGRRKDMIIRGGENIAPAAVERALMDIPGVTEAVVFGVPHADLGEEVMAVVVVEGETSPDRLQEQLRTSLASFAVPSRWSLRRETLPMNLTGKVDKAALKAEARAARGGRAGDLLAATAMQSFQHVTPPLRLFQGPDSLRFLGRELERLNSRRAVIFCGASVAREGAMLDLVRSAMGERCAGVFSGVRAHSPAPSVAAAAQELQRLEADAVVAVGGGSAIVTARAASILLAEKGDVREPLHRDGREWLAAQPEAAGAEAAAADHPDDADDGHGEGGQRRFRPGGWRAPRAVRPQDARAIDLHPSGFHAVRAARARPRSGPEHLCHGDRRTDVAPGIRSRTRC